MPLWILIEERTKGRMDGDEVQRYFWRLLKYCGVDGKSKVSFWTLKTLASDDFDISRLTERQQIAYFAAQSASENTDLLKASPFRIDRMLAIEKESSISKTPISRTKSLLPKLDHREADIIHHSDPASEANELSTTDQNEQGSIEETMVREYAINCSEQARAVEYGAKQGVPPSVEANIFTTYLTPELEVYQMHLDQIRERKRSIATLKA